MQILRQTSGSGHPHSLSSSAAAQKKHAEAKLVLQLASWMAATGQGAKADITGRLLKALRLYADNDWLIAMILVAYIGAAVHTPMCGCG